jgi:hypothetical protein
MLLSSIEAERAVDVQARMPGNRKTFTYSVGWRTCLELVMALLLPEADPTQTARISEL